MARAVAYARFSSEHQDTNTIFAQFRAIKEVAKRADDRIVAQYKDEGISGRSADREGFANMLKDIGFGKLQVEKLYVYKYSRFMRNQFEALFYKKKLESMGVALVSATEPLPDEKNTAELMESMIHAVNQYQSGVIGAQSLAGSKEIVRKGYWSGGPPPFGYRLEEIRDREGCTRNGKPVMRSILVVDENEARIVRRIYELAAESGFGGVRIYRRLCDEFGGPVHGRKGRPLGARGVNAILRNPIYKGEIVYNDYGYRNVFSEK